MSDSIQRDAMREYIRNNIITTGEAVEILGFTRQYLGQLVRNGEIEPIKKGLRVYLKSDIIALKKERDLRG